MVLVQKWLFFLTFFFRQNRPGKCLLRYFTTKKLLSRLQKQKVLKVEKLTFFQRGKPMVLVKKMAIFLNFFFEAIQARKMSFTIFYNEKIPFQAIKTRNSKRLKIDIFPIELTHGFSPKKAIFFTFFSQYRPEKCFYDILERQKRLSRL